METTKEKVNYCIGLETGKNLRLQFADIDTEKLLDGLLDGLNENDPKLTAQEIGSVLSSLKNQIEEQRKKYIAEVAESNKATGEKYLEDNKAKDGVVSLPSGLQYKVVSKGSGKKPTLFDSVKIHYTGSFIDGTVFDSSHKRGEPTQFPVNGVIPGWSEALQLMQEGDKIELFIPPYLAYGEQGFGREIGPNTTLLFEVELLEVAQA